MTAESIESQHVKAGSEENLDDLLCAVVVVNFNGGEYILRCLESLEQQIVTNSRVEIVVVDNASTDGSDQLVALRFPDIRLIRSPTNVGFGGGVNLGIAATTADPVVLLNNDATAEPGFLEAITAPFHSGNTSLGAVTGQIVLTGRFAPAPGAVDAYVSATGERWARLPDGADHDAGLELLNSTGSQMSRSGNGRDRSWLAPTTSAAGATAEVFGFCGGAAALSRLALQDVGLFDEGLFMYYEDTDLSWRMRRHGWEIRYVADAVVRHRHAASSGIRSQLFLTHNIRNRVLVTARNGPPAMLRAALVRTVGNLVKTLARSFSPRTGADARKQASAAVLALAQVVRKLPAYRAEGRRGDRATALPRDFVYRWTVDD